MDNDKKSKCCGGELFDKHELGKTYLSCGACGEPVADNDLMDNQEKDVERLADKSINSLELNIHDKCPRCHGEECSYCEGYGYIYNALGLSVRHKIIEAINAALRKEREKTEDFSFVKETLANLARIKSLEQKLSVCIETLKWVIDSRADALTKQRARQAIESVEGKN